MTIDTPSAQFSSPGGRATLPSASLRPPRLVDDEEQSGSRIGRLFGAEARPFSWLESRETVRPPPPSPADTSSVLPAQGAAFVKENGGDERDKMEAVRTLISGLAHQIRNPCATVRNNLFLLDHRLKALARERPDLTHLVSGLRRYHSAALEGVLRIETTMGILRRILYGDIETRVPFDLSAVTREAVEAFHGGRGANHDIEVSLVPAAPLVGDPRRVREVLDALLDNAAEAMPRGGPIRVGTKAGSKGAEIDVADAGVGVPPEFRKRIFEPYFTSKPDHAGLGLAVARGIVSAHGGRLDFESAPSTGSRFRVSFPT